MSSPPQEISIYHIVHVDRLPSILQYNGLFCDAEIIRKRLSGTTIGFNNIKQRRLTELTLESYPDLYVGSCVPFYFCPRSIMLYVIYMRNPELAYQDGQEQIIHLVADFYETVDWADSNNQRWAFTTSNAGSRCFSNYSDLRRLNEIDWNAVHARSWSGCKEEKQSEFLLERHFPWHLVKRIGVISKEMQNHVTWVLRNETHKPIVEVIPEWYY